MGGRARPGLQAQISLHRTQVAVDRRLVLAELHIDVGSHVDEVTRVRDHPAADDIPRRPDMVALLQASRAAA